MTLFGETAPHDHLQCWKKADIPNALHYGHNPRVPPVICMTEVGRYVLTRQQRAGFKDINRGSHGYDPASPEMAALFDAERPAFRTGVTRPPFDDVDGEPLMAKLLDLKAPTADGSAKVFEPALQGH